MICIIEFKIRDTFYSGKYGENFPKYIDMYIKNGDRKIGPFVLDLYRCNLVVPEVIKMLEKALLAFPDIIQYKIEFPTDVDVHGVFPFIIGVVYATFKHKVNVEIDHRIKDFYGDNSIERAIKWIERE